MKSIIISVAMIFSMSAFANHHKHHKMEFTPEQRKGMAEVHEKMAACLRSDKSMEECHKEMKQTCEEKMGKDGCPMMAHMGDMHHKMGKMMKEEHEHNEDEKKSE